MLGTDLPHYRRNLPHRLPPGENLFITFRLADSLPRIVLEKLRAEWEVSANPAEEAEQTYARQKRYFGRFDALLDKAATGPLWLQEPLVAAVVKEALHFHDGKKYLLVCYCVMPNHVHLVVTLPDNAPPLAQSLQSIKSYTATKANKLLNRAGQFWQRESYDHIVRDAEEMKRVVSYVLEDPIKAGLTTDWQLWPPIGTNCSAKTHGPKSKMGS
jgi:putative transposase